MTKVGLCCRTRFGSSRPGAKKVDVPKVLLTSPTLSQHDLSQYQLLSATSLRPTCRFLARPRTFLPVMDTQEKSDTGRKPGPKPLQSSSVKTQYLILYNFVSAILWLVVLGRAVLLVPLVGFGRVYPGVGQFTKWTQTMAVLEVVHSVTGEHKPSS